MRRRITDTERLDFMLRWRATVQQTGTWSIVRDDGGRILGEDETPRDAIDDAILSRGAF